MTATDPTVPALLALLLAPLSAQVPAPPEPTPPPQPKPAPHTELSRQLRKIATRSPIVVAHRGASGSHPENTLPAFSAALRAGAPMVELDFYQTEDRVLVCFHDKTLDRTTDSVVRLRAAKLRIADHTLAELQRLDAGSWKAEAFTGTRIPTLSAALRLIQPRAITMVEHKHGDPAVLVALLRRLKLVDRVLVQSFDWRFLAHLHRLEPDLTLGALGGSKQRPRPVGEVLRDIEKTHSSMVHWSFKHLTEADVERLHQLGYLVCVYTVNSPADYDRALAMGVDAITTDHPARLRAHLQERRRRETGRR